MAQISDDMKEIVGEFIIESEEMLGKLDQELINLEKSPDDRHIMDGIFRIFHTMKGSAGFLGFPKIVEIVHRVESILNMLRQAEMEFNPDINDLILNSADRVLAILSDLKAGNAGELDITDIVPKLDKMIKDYKKDAPAIKPPAVETSPPANTVSTEKKEPAQPVVESASKPVPIVPPEEKKDIPPPAKENPVEKADAQSALKSSVAVKQDKIKNISEDQTLRVDIKRLDNVMNLVGELVLIRNQLANLQIKLDSKYGDDESMGFLSSTIAHLNLVTTDLQLSVMKTRMQPVKRIFGKFPRMVRDIARDNKKNIELIISGEDTELDKSVLEEIGDPLVHLIRNSVDHGIEKPEVRKEASKPEVGTIKLSAYQEGNNIVIEISDDGKGIDLKKVAAKALAKGLITEKDMETVPERDIVNFIFLPGFSTAEVVTDISGRGVGMDVVRTNIMRLGGIIDIKTEFGIGTRMLIKLPITVAIIQSLMVMVKENIFAIPLSSVLEIIKISPQNDIQTVDKQEVVRARDTVIPILRLAELFHINKKEDITIDKSTGKHNDNSFKSGDLSTEKLYAVVIGFGEKQVGIIVERLIGQQEVVIKSMGKYLSNIEGIAGATIDGDGKVVLIIDIASLFKSAFHIKKKG